MNEHLTKEEVAMRSVLVALVIGLCVFFATSCSAAYISVPRIGVIMDQARADAAKAAAEISMKGIVPKSEEPPVIVEPTEEPAPSEKEMFDKIVKTLKSDITSYDYGNSSLSKALSSKKGNCLTYSLYMKIACDSVGIPCSVVFATKDPNSLSAGMHIWNRVTIDGTKYWCDMSASIVGGVQSLEMTKTTPASFKGYSNYYVLNVSKGTYKELTELKKSFTYKEEKVACSAASQTVRSAKNEYAKCYSVVSEKFN